MFVSENTDSLKSIQVPRDFPSISVPWSLNTIDAIFFFGKSLVFLTFIFAVSLKGINIFIFKRHTIMEKKIGFSKKIIK